MKVSADKLLFFIMLISLFNYGIIAEGITVACMIIAIIFERKRIKEVIGYKYYKICEMFVLLYCVLFLVHVVYLDHSNGEIIRLYGLTKNICFPALMVLAFAYLCTSFFPIRIILCEMTVFNLIYTAAFMTRTESSVVSYQLGSINGCSGISIVLLPAAFIYLKYVGKYYSLHSNQRFVAYAFIFTTIVLVMISDSSTSQILMLAELLAYLISVLMRCMRFKASLKGIIVLTSIGAIAISLFIATGKIPLDANELKTRVGIWTRAYNQFSSTEGAETILGTGDNIVHMLTKNLEAHNMFLEILLIHGIAGLVVVTLYIISTENIILKMNLLNIKPFLLSFTVYLTICCMHPFYTGSSLFQFNCIAGLISILALCRIGQKDESLQAVGVNV